MLQKLIVGVLALTVLGAVAVGLYDASHDDADAAPSPLLVMDTAQVIAPEQAALPQQALTATPAAGTGPVLEQQQQAVDMVGEPWTASGTIAGLETSGMTLALSDGTQIFVELGPSHYWAEQGVTLVVGDIVTVDGFYNGEQYHAATVTTVDGVQLTVRSDTGLPLWSGGASGSQNQNGTTAGQTETQVAAEDWITVEGTVTLVNGSTLDMQTTTGETLALQLGQASFMQTQGVTFAPGETISVTGFWQGTTFRAGDITKLATGERLMLLDPNGRPLWAGPGRNGQGGQTATGQSGQAAGGQGQGGQGSGGQGQGQNRNQVAGIPADQWEMIQGSVSLTEPLALILQLTNGELVRVALGQTDFWTEQGLSFPVGDTLMVRGFWQNGQFEAGEITFVTSGEILIIRNTDGTLVYANQAGGQGNGGQGQGQGGQSQGSQGGQGQGQGGQGGGGNGNGYRGGRQ